MYAMKEMLKKLWKLSFARQPGPD